MSRFALHWLCAAALVGAILPRSVVAQTDHPQPTISHEIPSEVQIPGEFSGNPIAFFDDFSWREFVAINWPAVSGQRGTADPNGEFGAADEVVWETWKADYELFQPNGQRPSVWDSFATVSPCPDLPVNAAGRAKVLSASGSAQGLAMSHYNQAGIGPPIGTLAAQNGTYARYEVRINREEYDFIRGPDGDQARWFYLRANLPTGQGSESLVFPAGAIELKAAWREFKLPQEEDLLERYYTREAIVVDPAGTCSKKTMGLVGLHIVHRTPSMREWVWSTFEHVDNLSDAPPGIRPTFMDRQGSQNPNDPNVNKLLPVVDEANPPQPNPAPVQVVRLKPIHDSTNKTNALYREHPRVRDTVWANYKLVMTQWPTAPAPDDATFRAAMSKPNPAYPADAGLPFPAGTNPQDGTAISNATMETTGFIQRTQSCMKCHLSRPSEAPKTEFVWFLRLRAYPTDDATGRELARELKGFSDERLSPP